MSLLAEQIRSTLREIEQEAATELIRSLFENDPLPPRRRAMLRLIHLSERAADELAKRGENE